MHRSHILDTDYGRCLLRTAPADRDLVDELFADLPPVQMMPPDMDTSISWYESSRELEYSLRERGHDIDDVPALVSPGMKLSVLFETHALSDDAPRVPERRAVLPEGLFEFCLEVNQLLPDPDGGFAAVEWPSEVIFNKFGVPHHPRYPAMIYPDGYEIYYVDGLMVPDMAIVPGPERLDAILACPENGLRGRLMQLFNETPAVMA